MSQVISIGHNTQYTNVRNDPKVTDSDSKKKQYTKFKSCQVHEYVHIIFFPQYSDIVDQVGGKHPFVYQLSRFSNFGLHLIHDVRFPDSFPSRVIN